MKNNSEGDDGLFASLVALGNETANKANIPCSEAAHNCPFEAPPQA